MIDHGLELDDVPEVGTIETDGTFEDIIRRLIRENRDQLDKLAGEER